MTLHQIAAFLPLRLPVRFLYRRGDPIGRSLCLYVVQMRDRQNVS